MQVNDVIPLTISALNAIEDVDMTMDIKKEEEVCTNTTENTQGQCVEGPTGQSSMQMVEQKEEAISDDDQVIIF